MLLGAAADALAQDPGASMAQVAQLAGLARATLYRHFRNRQELLEAIRAEALAYATEAIAGSELDKGSALEALRRAVDALAAFGVRFRVLLIEGADLDPAFLDQRAEVLAPLHRVVRRGQEAGLIRSDLPPEWVVTAMASLLVAGVRSSSSVAIRDGSLADLVFGTLTRGVAIRS